MMYTNEKGFRNRDDEIKIYIFLIINDNIIIVLYCRLLKRRYRFYATTFRACQTTKTNRLTAVENDRGTTTH